MKTVVIKRDGCQVPFDEVRIKEAVERAALAVGVVDADYCATVAEWSLKRWKTSRRLISVKFKTR